MKIALITAKPNKNNKVGNFIFNTSEKRPPNGIGYLYSILKKNHEVDIYDRYCGNYNFPNRLQNYDFAGIYTASVCTDDISWLLNNINSKVIAVGGPHASLFPDWFNKFNVKYVVHGEAEHIINDLVTGKIKEKFIKTERLDNKDLDTLPRFPYEYFYQNFAQLYNWNFIFDKSIKPVFTMNTSRSCPHNCSFCSVKKIWGKKYTFMSSERIIDDIEYLYNTFQCKGIYFREDSFTTNQQRIIDFCTLLLKKNIQVKWACEARVDSADESLLKLMSEAGCCGFYLGIESGSNKMLKIYKKGIVRDEIISFCRNCKKYSIRFAASLITNHPEETIQDKIDTNSLMNIIKPDFIWTNPFREDI